MEEAPTLEEMDEMEAGMVVGGRTVGIVLDGILLVEILETSTITSVEEDKTTIVNRIIEEKYTWNARNVASATQVEEGFDLTRKCRIALSLITIVAWLSVGSELKIGAKTHH